MSCKCKQVDSIDIVADLIGENEIALRHLGCGEKFSRQVILCRCDTIERWRPQDGLHFKGCPTWSALRKQAVRDRLDGKPEISTQKWKPINPKYLGFTKRGKRFRVKP